MSVDVLDLVEETPRSFAKERIGQVAARRIHEKYGKLIELSLASPFDDGEFVLRSKGCVGLIPVTDDLQVRIQPKVPIKSLFRLLELVYDLPSLQILPGHAKSDAIQEVYEILASTLTRRVLDRVRKGLYRGYVEEQDSFSYLRGRVLIGPSLRNTARGVARLECEFEDHTADLDDNRILAWTLGCMQRLPIGRRDVRLQVRQAFRALANDVQVQPYRPRDCIDRNYHRLNDDYRPLHGLCRFFLENSGAAHAEGRYDFLPFTLDMPSLFEKFVARWLLHHLPDHLKLDVQHRAVLDSRGDYEFQIDLVLRNRATNRPLAVMDTKYKLDGAPQASDIEQVVAYAATMRTSRAFLVYPTPPRRRLYLTSGYVERVEALGFEMAEDPDEAGRAFIGELLACMD